MKISVVLFLLLCLLPHTVKAGIFSDIRAKAGSDPETFWTKNKIHVKPSTNTLGKAAYDSLTIKQQNTILGDEGSPCIDCSSTRNFVDEYLFNIFLRIATNEKLAPMESCNGDEDTFIGLEYLGVFDPLFINGNVLSTLINNGPESIRLLMDQSTLPMLFNRIGIKVNKEIIDYEKCTTLFLKILQKNMSYYGLNKSLKIKDPDRKKVEPLYYYSIMPSNTVPSDIMLSDLKKTLDSAQRKCSNGAEHEFVCYANEQGIDYSDFDRPAGMVKKIQAITKYTYRPVKDECRASSYLIGSEFVDSGIKASDIYEIWAVPQVIKNPAKQDNYLSMRSNAKLINGKLPSKKWNYHVAIVTITENIPMVLDRLFFNIPVSIAEWQKLFDPSTRFMARPFVKTTIREASLCSQKDIKAKGATPHPVYE